MMWSKTTYWNPLFFVGTWVGVTFLMYSLGPSGYPGWRRHVALALVSVPLWWWFELVNARVENWKYIILYDYGDVGYAFLASLTFSTVVPALDSAWRMYVGLIGPAVFNAEPDRRLFVGEVVAGAASLVALFALPGQLFGLVWVGPFRATSKLMVTEPEVWPQNCGYREGDHDRGSPRRHARRRSSSVSASICRLKRSGLSDR